MKRFALKEVIYPTGGKTRLELEAHEYDVVTADPNLGLELRDATKSIDVSASGTSTGVLDFSNAYGNIKMTITFVCTSAEAAEALKQRGTIYGQVINGTSLTTVYLSSNTANLDCTPGNGSVCVSQVYDFDAQYFRGPSYKIYVDPNVPAGSLSMVRIHFKYQESVLALESNLNKFLYAGGLRIREVTDYDGEGNVAKSRKYDYRYQEDRNSDGQPENYSYGKKISPLRYHRYNYHYECDATTFCYSAVSFNRYNSSITSVNTSSSSPVGYSQVTEYTYDRSTGGTMGKSVYHYDNEKDLPGDYMLNTLNSVITKHYALDVRFPGIPSEQNISNGVLTKKTDYVNAGNGYREVSETVNEYENLLVNKYYSFKYQTFPGDGVGKVIMLVYPALKQERHLLKQTVTKHFDQQTAGKVLSNTIQYAYGPHHLSPLEIKQWDSKGGEILTKMTYPADYGTMSSTVGGIKTLQEKHVVASPVEKYVLSRNAGATVYNVISGSLNRYYEDKPLLKEALLLEGGPLASTLFKPSNQVPGSFAPDANYKPGLHYDQYDGKGNLLTYHLDANIPITYLWGYYQAYPVAEIRNATYEQAKAALGIPPGGELDLGAGGLTAAQETSLRNGLSQALITTYTYNSLIGMTSKTDPNGVTIFYEYDGLGRLRVVKDRDQHPVSQYKYHYKQ